MPTKAELQQRVEYLEQRLDEEMSKHQAFRKAVVAEAMKLAKRHGWCDVVRQGLGRMNLGDLLPPLYFVQRRYDGGNWQSIQRLNTLGEGQRALRDCNPPSWSSPPTEFRLIEKAHGKRLKVLATK